MGADSSPTAAPRPWRTADAQVLIDDLADPGLETDSIHHLRRVLRLGPGATICATDGRGGWRLCSLGAEGELEALGEVERVEAPSPVLTVGFAALKGGRNELVVQKLTELGIDRIWVLQCDHSVVRWDGARAQRQRERLGRVVTEAMSQCRRLWRAEVELLEFTDAIERGGADGPGFTADTISAQPVPAQPVPAQPVPAQPVPAQPVPAQPVLADSGGRGLTHTDRTVLVGPEGGWSGAERDRAGSVELGEHVLRAETAAIVAGATMAQLRLGLQRPGLSSLSP